MSSDDNQNKEGTLRSLDLRLPPLPQTLPQVLDLLHTPGFADAKDIAEVVQHDPAIVARLLKRINSAYYGLRRSITDVERAIRMMGPTTAAGTAISAGMHKMREMVDGPASEAFTRLICHSESTAYLTRFLLDRLPRKGEGEESGPAVPAGDGFTAGLLHDFGKLVLIYNEPDKAVSLYQEKVFEEYLAETDARTLEQLVFGCDHTEAGAYAALEMSFPSVLVDVIRHHHEPDTAPAEHASKATLRAVFAADLATKAMGSPLMGVRTAERELDWDACEAHPIWTHWLDDPGADGTDAAALMEALQEKKKSIFFFTEFFLDDANTSIQA